MNAQTNESTNVAASLQDLLLIGKSDPLYRLKEISSMLHELDSLQKELVICNKIISYRVNSLMDVITRIMNELTIVDEDMYEYLDFVVSQWKSTPIEFLSSLTECRNAMVGYLKYCKSDNIRVLLSYSTVLIDYIVIELYNVVQTTQTSSLSEYIKEREEELNKFAVSDNVNNTISDDQYKFDPNGIIKASHYDIPGIGDSMKVILALVDSANVNTEETIYYFNALKYLFRYSHKGTPLQDLKKSRDYINRIISLFEEK